MVSLVERLDGSDDIELVLCLNRTNLDIITKY